MTDVPFNAKRNYVSYIFDTFRSSRPEVLRKKGVLKIFLKLTDKHLCQNFFFNKKGLRQAP